MFLPFRKKQRELSAHDERDAGDGDRDLVVLINEARTSSDLASAVKMARMRRAA